MSKLNYQVVYDRGHPYIEFLDGKGKVLFGREMYGYVLEKIDDYRGHYVPDFKLLENEEIVIGDGGNLFVSNKRTGRIINI